jgi:hypothetical protein
MHFVHIITEAIESRRATHAVLNMNEGETFIYSFYQKVFKWGARLEDTDVNGRIILKLI